MPSSATDPSSDPASSLEAGSLLAGIDIGGTKCLGLCLAVDGSVVVEERMPTPKGAENLCDTVAAVVEALSANAGAPIGAVGVGAPGPRRPRRRAPGGAQPHRCRRDADPRHARRAARHPRDRRQRRDVRDRGRVASRRGDGRVGRVAHHARHRHRGWRRQRRRAAARSERLHVRAGPHGRRPERPTVCLRPPRLLGAVRIGQWARTARARRGVRRPRGRSGRRRGRRP